MYFENILLCIKYTTIASPLYGTDKTKSPTNDN